MMEKKQSRGDTQNANAEPVRAIRSDPPAENAPDPDQDDLDDLDDLLDEFSTAKPDTLEDGKDPSRSDQQSPEQSHLDRSDTAGTEFTKQLQEQMAALIGDADKSPGMKREIEAVMQELGAAADPGHVSELGVRPESKRAVPGAEESFQETIRKTMERMQASGEQATAAASSEDQDDVLAQMLKEMQGDGIEGPGNEEDFSAMLMGMMQQLTNKEILYEPMKELHDKYPAWMSKNKHSTKQEDLRRYEEQQRLVGEIVGKFEGDGYSDSHPADREYIVERMQQMQAAGSPPADLVGDMNAAQEALGDLDTGCAQQ